MKELFNFQIKLDDKQSSVIFGMEECKGVDIELVNGLSKLFLETKGKINKFLEKGGTKEKDSLDSSTGSEASNSTKNT